jgi:hypothetical protein
MAYYLNYDTTTFTGTALVQFPAWSAAGSVNFTVEVDFLATSLSSLTYLLGAASRTQRSIAITDAGAIIFPGLAVSSAGHVEINTEYSLKFESVGSAKKVYIKPRGGASWGSSILSFSSTASFDFDYIGRALNVLSRQFKVYAVRFVGGTYNEVWDGSNAPSSGLTWTGTNGSAITLNGTTGVADSWWIFYDDGGAVTSTIAATWPQLSIAASQTSTIPDTDSAMAFTWPQLSVSAEQITIAPVSNSVAFNWPQLSVSASQSSTAPQFDSAANFTWPQLTVSTEQSAAYSGNVVNFTWPQLSVLANQSATIPGIETAASFTWPQLTVGINQITPSDNPEYNFPISGYRNNNQWRFSPFFKQTK